jgi:hypothetical protein
MPLTKPKLLQMLPAVKLRLRQKLLPKQKVACRLRAVKATPLNNRVDSYNKKGRLIERPGGFFVGVRVTPFQRIEIALEM